MEKIYRNILNGNAILITGSGAHMTVKNHNGENFPSGVNLAKKVYELCGVEAPDNEYDLQDATDTFVEKFSEEMLIKEIKKQLSVANIEDSHRNLYSHNWQRIYTTNYDEVPIIASKNEILPVTLSSKRSSDILLKKLCVYINGYIGNLNNKTINNEFKLTGKSYMASQSLADSEWGDVFSEDICTCENIVVIGLSLDYDLEIKRFLYDKKVIEKTIFVMSSDLTENRMRKLKRLGTVLPIGMEAFLKGLSDYETIYDAGKNGVDWKVYKCFEVYNSRRNLKQATMFNIYDLFMYGNYVDDLWHRKVGKYYSIVYRDALRIVFNTLKSGCKVVFLHANLGNGKTMFIESLKHQGQNYYDKIFTLKETYQNLLSKEIKNIMDEPGKKLVIIENYYNYISVIKQFSIYDCRNVQFVFSARSVIYDTRLNDVYDYFNISCGDCLTIDLNKLTQRELRDFDSILVKNGLWGECNKSKEEERIGILSSSKGGNRQLQGILLSVLKSTLMREKVANTVTNIKKMSEIYYKVLILALLIKVMSLNVRANDMNGILGINIALDSKFTSDPDVKEILDFTSGETSFKLKSAVTANIILKELECNDAIIDVLIKTAKYADKYKNNERFENVLKNIVSFSHVSTFLIKSEQSKTFLVKYYDELKEIEYYKTNSFYWLQYAIACMDIERYDLAQQYLDCAYGYFRHSDEIVPFQIDTQQAMLYLRMIKADCVQDVKATFTKAHDILTKPITSRKNNPIKVILAFKHYTDCKIKDNLLKAGGLEEYCKSCSEAFNYINKLADNIYNERDKQIIDSVKKELIKCKTFKMENRTKKNARRTKRFVKKK